MKKLLLHSLVALLFVTVIIPQSAHGQKFAVYVNSGLTVPVSPDDLKMYFDKCMGYQFGINYDLTNVYSVRLFMSSSTWDLDRKAVLKDRWSIANLREGNISAVTGMVNVVRKFTLKNELCTPFINVGAGIYHITSQKAFITVPDIQTGRELIYNIIDLGDDVRFGYNTGIGIMFRASGYARILTECNLSSGINAVEQNSFLAVIAGVLFYL